MNATFRSLEVRNFRLFFGGQLISQAGTWMRQIAMALLVLHLTDDGVAVGVMTACQFLPVLVLGPWAGLVADRSDKRRLLLVVQTGLMAQSFALAALASLDDPPLAGLYAIALLGGIGTAFDNPTRRSFVVEMVPETHVQNAVSLNSALMTGSRIFGPAIAGVLITTAGFAWTFAADGVSYLAVLAGLWLMRTEELRPAPPAVRGRGQVRAGLRYMRRVPALWVSLVMMAIVGTFAFNFSVTLPLLVKRAFDGTDQGFTLLFSVLSIGSMAGALWTARRTTVELSHVVLSSVGFGVSMIVLALAPNLAWAFPAGILLGLTSITFMTSSTTLLQLRADPSMRGRVLAIQAMVFLGSTPVGGPIVGWVAESWGSRAAIALGGVSCLAAAVFGVIAGRRALQREVPVGEDVVTTGADLQPA